MRFDSANAKRLKRALPLGAVLLALGLTACGGGDNVRRAGGGLNATDRFSQAVAQAENGNCAEAEPVLERLAKRGRGWELAQVHLGDCRLASGALDDAVTFYTLAAESNEPRAQARLALLYAEGEGVALDRAEAAKWYVLATRESLGELIAPSELPENFEARIRALLSADDLAAGEARAAVWIPSYQGVNAEALPAQPARALQGEGELRRPDRPRRQSGPGD